MVPLLPSEVEEPYTLPDIGSLMPGDTTLFYSAIPLQGEVGVPRPYSVSGDNAISILLLSCIVLTAVIIAQARWLVVEKTKEFFLTAHDDDYDVLTASAVFYLPLLLFCSLALSVGLYVMAGSQLPEGIHLPPIAIVGGFAAVLMLYIFTKYVLYAFVNNVFFGGKKSIQWGQAFLYVTALEGVLLFPLIVALVYFNILVKNAIYYCVAVLFLNKMLTFYKSYRIFFKQNGRYLENILYFCALEITPLLALGGLWMIMVNKLKVIF